MTARHAANAEVLAAIYTNAGATEQAKEIAYTDPLHLTNSSKVTVYEWKTE